MLTKAGAGRHVFPLSIAFGSTLLMVGYRFLIGAGLDAFLANPEDNFAYTALAYQAMQGKILFSDLYTWETHPAAYFNLYYLVLGNLSRLTGLPVITLFVCLGIIASAIVIFFIYHISRIAGFTEGAARWSVVLVAFSSGISVLGYIAGLPVIAGADLRHLDAILFSSFYTSPYQTFAFASQSIVILLILRCEQKPTGARFISLAVAQVWLVLTRPYDWFLLFAGLSGSIAFAGSAWRVRGRILLLLGSLTLPVVGYNYWLSRLPAWSNFAEISLSQQMFRLYWILGYGYILVLALIGCWLTFRNESFRNARWLAVSAVVSILLLVVFNIKQVKLATCGS
ncbi:MAG TPA: hypothetical protein VI958_00695, partial [Acidobacteriota bacterium]